MPNDKSESLCRGCASFCRNDLEKKTQGPRLAPRPVHAGCRRASRSVERQYEISTKARRQTRTATAYTRARNFQVVSNLPLPRRTRTPSPGPDVSRMPVMSFSAAHDAASGAYSVCRMRCRWGSNPTSPPAGPGLGRQNHES